MEKLWTQRAAGVRLTAAVLVRAVGAVGLLVTLVTGRDAGSIAQALKLLRCTSVVRTLGGCGHLPKISIHIDSNLWLLLIMSYKFVVFHIKNTERYKKLQFNNII